MTIYHKTIGQGPDVVLLHGWGLHCGIWQPIIEKLKSDFTLHLIDLPGFGLSEACVFPDNIETCLQQLLPILPNQATYIGWSLGGLIAMALTIDYPEKVSSLVLISTTPCFLETQGWNGVTEDYFNEFRENVKINTEKTLQQFILLALAHRDQQKKYYAELSEMVFSSMPDKQSLLNALNVLRDTDLRERVNKISCPVLNFRGEFDPLIKVNSNWEQRIIEGAGHVPIFTHALTLTKPIKRFIDGC